MQAMDVSPIEMDAFCARGSFLVRSMDANAYMGFGFCLLAKGSRLENLVQCLFPDGQGRASITVRDERLGSPGVRTGTNDRKIIRGVPYYYAVVFRHDRAKATANIRLFASKEGPPDISKSGNLLHQRTASLPSLGTKSLHLAIRVWQNSDITASVVLISESLIVPHVPQEIALDR